MKGVWIAAACLGIVGAALWAYSLQWPYYVTPNAAADLSAKMGILSSEQMPGWVGELRKLETPRKALEDWGVGVITVGIGLAMLGGASLPYRNADAKRRVVLFYGFWAAAFACLVPGAVGYYLIRYERFDYPMGADAIAIPICRRTEAAVILWIATLPLIAACLWGRTLPRRWQFVRPSKIGEWTRFILISIWIGISVYDLPVCVSDGDIGGILLSLGTGSLLALALSAPKRQAGAR